MTLAVVTCVRDEAAILPAFLAYHRALGVVRFYVYLDRTSDASEEIVRGFDGAIAIVRDRSSREPDLVTHQLACADDALARARADEIEWLLHVDVDEFAFGENPGPDVLARGDLRAMLDRADADTEAVVLRTLEVVPRADLDGAPFWTLHDVQDGGVLERDVLDPGTGTRRRLARLIGHDQGKSAVRVAADVQAGTPHVWTRRQGRALPEVVPIRTEQLGCHLHFVVRGARHWWEKYRKLADDPAYWPRGAPVPFPKQAWKEAAAGMDLSEGMRYARAWVLVDEAAIVRGRQDGVLHHVTHVEDVLGAVRFVASHA